MYDYSTLTHLQLIKNTCCNSSESIKNVSPVCLGKPKVKTFHPVTGKCLIHCDKTHPFRLDENRGGGGPILNGVQTYN